MALLPRIRPRQGLLPALLLTLPALLWAETTAFPDLTGRVVDRAEMLSPEAEARLTQMLQAHEQASTEQVVVVTLPDLQGLPIEDYGYQLGRHWGIGQEGEDSGALLIVAEAERKIRIEVGYGLEGRLTDAQSAVIINRVITPAFRQGDFQAGILDGAGAMIKVLGGTPMAVPRGGQTQTLQEQPGAGLVSLFFIIMMAIVFLFGSRGGRGGRGGAALLGAYLLGGAMGGRGGGGFGGGGFGGGGGSFGGGGASGGW